MVEDYIEEDELEQAVIKASMEAFGSEEETWFLDSRASSHVTCNK